MALFSSIIIFADNITTLDGKVYYNVEVINKTSTDMTVECTRTSIPENRVVKTLKLSRLDEATLRKYGYDPSEFSTIQAKKEAQIKNQTSANKNRILALQKQIDISLIPAVKKYLNASSDKQYINQCLNFKSCELKTINIGDVGKLIHQKYWYKGRDEAWARLSPSEKCETSDYKDWQKTEAKERFYGDTGSRSPYLSIIQIVDKDKMLISLDGKDSSRLYMMQGINTENYIDGQVIPLNINDKGFNGVFYASGTYRYSTTNGGTNTIKKLDSINIDLYKEYISLTK